MCNHGESKPILAAKPIKIKKPGQPCIDIPCGPDWYDSTSCTRIEQVNADKFIAIANSVRCAVAVVVLVNN